MTASHHWEARDLASRGRLWWLPSSGYGNGLDALSWAPILEVDARIVTILLAELGRAGVPAYAAARAGATPESRRFPHRDWPAYRLWVASTSYAAAEDVLMGVLPRVFPAPGGSSHTTQLTSPTMSRGLRQEARPHLARVGPRMASARSASSNGPHR